MALGVAPGVAPGVTPGVTSSCQILAVSLSKIRGLGNGKSGEKCGLLPPVFDVRKIINIELLSRPYSVCKVTSFYALH